LIRAGSISNLITNLPIVQNEPTMLLGAIVINGKTVVVGSLNKELAAIHTVITQSDCNIIESIIECASEFKVA
jgi:hypothetical protein